MVGWRTFFAVELSEEIAAGVRRIQGSLRERVNSVRWVRPEGIHLTLKFLGEVDADRIEEIARRAEEAVQGISPFTVGIRGGGGFPRAKNPRVVWIGVDDPSGMLAQLQARIEEEMEGLGFVREKRGYTPHLTVGRLRSAGRRGVAQALDGIRESDLGSMEVREICLFRSHLKPTGAEYTKLRSFPLQVAPQSEFLP